MCHFHRLANLFRNEYKKSALVRSLRRELVAFPVLRSLRRELRQGGRVRAVRRGVGDAAARRALRAVAVPVARVVRAHDGDGPEGGPAQGLPAGLRHLLVADGVPPGDVEAAEVAIGAARGRRRRRQIGLHPTVEARGHAVGKGETGDPTGERGAGDVHRAVAGAWEGADGNIAASGSPLRPVCVGPRPKLPHAAATPRKHWSTRGARRTPHGAAFSSVVASSQWIVRGSEADRHNQTHTRRRLRSAAASPARARAAAGPYGGEEGQRREEEQ
eukprot:gene12932-biopygen67